MDHDLKITIDQGSVLIELFETKAYVQTILELISDKIPEVDRERTIDEIMIKKYKQIVRRFNERHPGTIQGWDEVKNDFED